MSGFVILRWQALCLASLISANSWCQCPVKKPVVPVGPDTLCIGDPVRTSYAITSALKSDGPDQSLEWSLTGEPGSFVSSNNKLIPDSTRPSRYQIFVRQYQNANPACAAISSFVVQYLPTPPGAPKLKPYSATNEEPNRIVYVCEDCPLNLNDSLVATPGYAFKFRIDSAGISSKFSGKFAKAKYTASATNVYVSYSSSSSCPGEELLINVAVAPKPSPKNNPREYQVCETKPIFFDALDTHSGNNPTYDWYLNGKQMTTRSGPNFEINPNPFKENDPVKVFYVEHISRDAPYYRYDSVGPPWKSDTISIKIVPLSSSRFAKGSIKGPYIVYDGQQGAFYSASFDSTLVYRWRLSNYSQGGITAAAPAGKIASVNNTSKIDFIKGLDFSSRKEILDTLFVTVRNVCDSTTDSVIIHLRPYLRPINVLTPNGDDINDRWVVDNIDYPAYTDNEVSIYNRYGNSVYHAKGYSNLTAWDGTAGGKPLTEGTYFWVLLYKEDQFQKSIKGYVTILRK